MSKLSIVLSGVIEQSNFDEWKTELVEQIRSVKTELKTDDDFAAATKHVKQFKAAEKSLKQAKKSALEQAAEINALFAAIDTVSEEARQARLKLDKQIKKRKQEIKADFIAEGVETVTAFIEQQSDAFKSVDYSAYTDDDIFADAISGKASTKGMQKAITKTCESIKQSITEKAADINANAATLANLPPNHKALFQDESHLLALSPAQLDTTIDERIKQLDKQSESSEDVKDSATDTPEELPVDVRVDVQADEAGTSELADTAQYTVTVEITATEDDADAIRTAIVDAVGSNTAVGNIILAAR